MIFPILWAVLFAIGLVVEGFTLFNKLRNDTLSEQVWMIRTRRWVRMILLPFWSWLTWHFFIEPSRWTPQQGIWRDDVVIIVASVILAAFISYQDTNEK